MSRDAGAPAELEARVAELETKLQRYQKAFDAISQGVAFFDHEQRLIMGNRRYAEIYRLTPDQIPPTTTLREITERRAAVGACPMAVDDYIAYVASINAKREDRDWSIRLDDGRSINVRYRPMADGGWISIHEDATDLREKRLLIEERISQQSLIDVVPDNLWVKDVESRFVVANRATALRMGHASPQELIGKSDLELCPWETAQKYLADEREVIESGRPMIDSEEYVLAPDGAKVWIATTKAPLRNERGEVVGIIGVSRDVTRRRLADALREGQAEILQMIVGGASAEIVLEELVHLVESQSNGTVVAIVPLADNGRKLRRSVTSLAEIEVQSGQLLAGPLGETVRRGDLVIVPDIASDPAWAEQRERIGALGLRACWSTPIMSQGGEPLGVLAVFAHSAREPKEAEIKLAQVAAQLAAIAIGRSSAKATG
ncbi:MAG: PAS domain-containing protein [Roseiarcus sp.]|uniref:PAS domain-containing protein n=1 Tax=Roseiarcus sp. TaxID=1969460 RepID=UPI003C23A228